MSTIIATTLSNGSVSVPTATVVNGSAKAWVNFNGSGTVAIRDSLNVTSITDQGTGDYLTNYTNSFAAADYSANCNLGYGSTTREAVCFFLAGSYLAGSANVLTGYTYTSPGAGDQTVVTMQAFGDLA